MIVTFYGTGAELIKMYGIVTGVPRSEQLLICTAQQYAGLQEVHAQLGIEPDETTADGRFSLERIECNAACDFAPVMMVNWEFMDNMTPAKAERLIDDLAAGKDVASTRGATITSWREAERVLAGFPDGRADEGPSAGEASLLGKSIADANGWAAPKPEDAK